VRLAGDRSSRRSGPDASGRKSIGSRVAMGQTYPVARRVARRRQCGLQRSVPARTAPAPGDAARTEQHAWRRPSRRF